MVDPGSRAAVPVFSGTASLATRTGDRQERPGAVRRAYRAGCRESGEFRMGVIRALTLLKDTKHDWAVYLALSYPQVAC